MNSDFKKNRKKFNLLLIDIGYSYNELRPCTQEIYFKGLSKLGHKVILLLRKKLFSTNNFEVPGENKTYFRPTIKLSRYTFDLGLFFVILKILRKEKIDIIQVRNDVLSGFIGLIAARISKKPFVFIRAFPNEEFALQHIRLGLSKLGILKLPLIKLKIKLSIIIMKKADLIFPQSEAFLNELTKYGIEKKKMFPIPMGFDCSINPSRISKEKVRRQYSLPEGKTIIYFGDMSPVRKLTFLIKVIEKVKNHFHDVKLLMVGGNLNQINDLKEYARSKNLINNVIFTGKVPHKDVPYFLAASDVSVTAIPPFPTFIISSPTKAIESLGMATPVIANEEIYDQKKIITESGGGICVPYKEESFANAILKLLKSTEKKRRKMGQKGRDYIEKHRSYNKFAKDVEKYLTRLFSQN